eukprot:scaffold185212_cov26-Tisochrysis_lutea.AAC.2
MGVRPTSLGVRARLRSLRCGMVCVSLVLAQLTNTTVLYLKYNDKERSSLIVEASNAPGLWTLSGRAAHVTRAWSVCMCDKEPAL